MAWCFRCDLPKVRSVRICETVEPTEVFIMILPKNDSASSRFRWKGRIIWGQNHFFKALEGELLEQ